MTKPKDKPRDLLKQIDKRKSPKGLEQKRSEQQRVKRILREAAYGKWKGKGKRRR